MQMKLIVIKSLFMLLLIGLSACTFTSVHNDQESDQAKGKLFMNTFYYDIKAKNYDHLLKSTSDSLIKLAGSENFLNLFKNINQKVGDYSKRNIKQLGAIKWCKVSHYQRDSCLNHAFFKSNKSIIR